MSKPASLLIHLQGKAKVLDVSKIAGINKEETHVWKLSDGCSIVIHATSNMQNGQRAARIMCAEKLDKPFKTVVANIKRKVTMSLKQKKVQLCI
jgi:hypothetical protein